MLILAGGTSFGGHLTENMGGCLEVRDNERHADGDVGSRAIHDVDICRFDSHSVLVHLYKGRAFRMVEPFDGGAIRQHPHVVFPCFLELAGPRWNQENVKTASGGGLPRTRSR